jgi:hypothetical protein
MWFFYPLFISFILFTLCLAHLPLKAQVTPPPTPDPNAAAASSAAPAAAAKAPASTNNPNTAPVNVGVGGFTLMEDYSRIQKNEQNPYSKDTPVEALQAQEARLQKAKTDRDRGKTLIPSDSAPPNTTDYWEQRKQARYQQRKKERQHKQGEERNLQVPLF